MKQTVWFILLSLITMSDASAAEAAYARTKAGVIEIKTLPAGRLIEHAARGATYFDESNGLFGPLFRYIQTHDISMTRPVEARIEPGTMRFWISKQQESKADGDEGPVRVIDTPERKVAAIGGRGSYSRNNFERARDELMNWVAAQEGMEAVGEPFAAYWNGPFTPGFLKRYEVMVEVRPVGKE